MVFKNNFVDYNNKRIFYKDTSSIFIENPFVVVINKVIFENHGGTFLSANNVFKNNFVVINKVIFENHGGTSKCARNFYCKRIFSILSDIFLDLFKFTLKFIL